MTTFRRVFTAAPRVADARYGVAVVQRSIELAEIAQVDGVLHFTGAGSVLDPLVCAGLTCSLSAGLLPFIAMNPAYQHPVAAARAIASISHIYKRPVALNLITGTSLIEMSQLGGSLSHADRYIRLEEYANIVLSLLKSPRPTNYVGHYYNVENAQLLLRLTPDLMPLLYLAGASPEATMLARRLDAIQVGMLMPSNKSRPPGAVHFGLVVRESSKAAWARAHEAYPTNMDGRAVTKAIASSSDSVWKRELLRAVAEPGTMPGYWPGPLLDSSADCPFLVGSRVEISAALAELATRGVETLILDIPPTVEDHREVSHLMSDLRRTSA